MLFPSVGGYMLRNTEAIICFNMILTSVGGFMLKNSKDTIKKKKFSSFPMGAYTTCKRKRTFGKVSGR